MITKVRHWVNLHSQQEVIPLPTYLEENRHLLQVVGKENQLDKLDISGMITTESTLRK